MAQCKVCNKKYHNCSNCYNADWYNEFCSSQCFNQAHEKDLQEIQHVIDSIPEETIQKLNSLYQNWEDEWLEEMFWMKVSTKAKNDE